MPILGYGRLTGLTRRMPSNLDPDELEGRRSHPRSVRTAETEPGSRRQRMKSMSPPTRCRTDNDPLRRVTRLSLEHPHLITECAQGGAEWPLDRHVQRAANCFPAGALWRDSPSAPTETLCMRRWPCWEHVRETHLPTAGHSQRPSPATSGSSGLRLSSRGTTRSVL